MKTVFILGAGASVDCGAPLMRDFLKTAKTLQSRKAFGSDSNDIQTVLDTAFKDLRPVQVKSSIDYQNVEELFSAIDMGVFLGVFGSRNVTTLSDLGRAIRVFIYRTIEETVRIPFDGRQFGLLKGYSDLATTTLNKTRDTARLGQIDVSFITFNYDTCLEFALVRSGLGVNYGLSETFIDQDECSYQVSVPVMKLHGSINWAMCAKYNVIVPTEINPWRRASAISLFDQQHPLRLDLGTRIRGRQHKCGNLLDVVPYIVPPTWDKASGATGLKDVWRGAAKELASADNIVVIGYSMPATDTFFKYLYALGSDSDVHLEKFVVINGIDGQDTESRFRALLGPMSVGGFQNHSFVFSGAGRVIRDIVMS
jgi:hypothetical protein